MVLGQRVGRAAECFGVVFMRLGIVQKSVLLGVMALLFITGVWWAIASGELASPFGLLAGADAQRNFERETILISLHGVGAMVYLLALGALFPNHIRSGWISNRKRGSGSVMLAVNLVLIITAAFLYYGAPDGSRPLAAVVHLWVGLALPVMLLLHIRERVLQPRRRRK